MIQSVRCDHNSLSDVSSGIVKANITEINTY